MADLLDQIQQRQAEAQNQQLAQADTNNTWAQTFNSIPASDKVFAAQDLNDMIARMTAQKQAAIEASDPKIALAHARTQEVLDRTKHNNDMAGPAVAFKQAQFRAQQALERKTMAQETLNHDIQTHADSFQADMAHFHTANPTATQDVIDAHTLAVRDAYPHAMKNEGIKAAVSEAVGRQKALAAPALAGAIEKARLAERPVDAGFMGTYDEAKANFPPTATLHETSRGHWTATIPPADKPADAFKQAANLRSQIRQHENTDKAHEAEIAKLIEKNSWLADTTGPTTYKGTQYFGRSQPSDAVDNMTIATPARLAEWDRYQSLIKRRSEIQQKLPMLNDQLDALFSGGGNGAATKPDAAPVRPIFKDANGKRAYKNADGTFEEIP